MATRYFRKPSPKVKLWMFGRPIQFVEEGKFGYITSDDPQIQHHPKGADAVLAEIERGIREGQGAVSEIGAGQYENEFIKKKQQPNLSRAPKWREEISAGTSLDTLAPKVDRVAAAASKPQPQSIQPAPDTAPPAVTTLRDRANLGRI